MCIVSIERESEYFFRGHDRNSLKNGGIKESRELGEVVKFVSKEILEYENVFFMSLSCYFSIHMYTFVVVEIGEHIA